MVQWWTNGSHYTALWRKSRLLTGRCCEREYNMWVKCQSWIRSSRDRLKYPRISLMDTQLTDCVPPVHTARISRWSRSDARSWLADAPHTFVDDWLEATARPSRPSSVFWNMWMNRSSRNSDSIDHNETSVSSVRVINERCNAASVWHPYLNV